MRWHNALWPLEALEDSECEMEGGGRADCLPRNAEDKPTSPTRSAEAETVATAEAAATAVTAVEAEATPVEAEGALHSCG